MFFRSACIRAERVCKAFVAGALFERQLQPGGSFRSPVLLSDYRNSVKNKNEQSQNTGAFFQVFMHYSIINAREGYSRTVALQENTHRLFQYYKQHIIARTRFGEDTGYLLHVNHLWYFQTGPGVEGPETGGAGFQTILIIIHIFIVP